MNSLSLNTVLGLAVVLVSATLSVALEIGGVDPTLARASGLILFAIGFWALGILPEALTGLIFLIAAVIGGIAAPVTAFAGFTTTAFWLIFAGLILGAAVTRTGLAPWLATRLLPSNLSVGANAGGYGRVIALVVILSAGLALVLPSTMGRVVLLIPVIAALAGRLGYPDGSRGRTGMILAGGIGTYVVPVTFLPANLPNMVLAGSLEAIHGVTLTYGSYFFLHFPVIGLAKGIALVLLVTMMFRDAPVAKEEGGSTKASGDDPALSSAGSRLAIVLLLTLALWATDVFHGVAAAWVGMTAAIVCLLPAVRILPFGEFAAKVQLPMLLYIAAVLGLASVMMATGAGAALGQWLIHVVPLGEAGDAAILGSMAALAAITGLAATMPGAPAVGVPLFADIAALTGWSIEAIGMAQVMGYATPLLPYQLPPLVVALAMGGVKTADATKVMLLLAVTTTPIVFPLALYWWTLLGWLPS